MLLTMFFVVNLFDKMYLEYNPVAGYKLTSYITWWRITNAPLLCKWKPNAVCCGCHYYIMVEAIYRRVAPPLL